MKVFLKKFMARYLAFWARLVLGERRPRIVGVTGSVGKTTTKEAIFAALATPAARRLIGEVGKSAGNLNTEIGLPLSVLRYDEVPESVLGWLAVLVTVPIRAFVLSLLAAYPAVIVLEYAADRPGDISRLTRIARPDIAVVTAVGPAHLEKFLSVTAVAAEKAKLVRAVPPTGLTILGRDNSHAAVMARETHAPAIKIGGRGPTLSLGIARAVAAALGVPKTATEAALKQFTSLMGRLGRETIGRFYVIDDTYNANPLSMELALDTLTETAPARARKVVILGHMAELGAESERYHIEVGRWARATADLVIGVGQASLLYDADYWYPTSSAAAQAVGDHLRPGDALLVKGSRSAAMERVVAAIRKLARQPATKSAPREGYGND